MPPKHDLKLNLAENDNAFTRWRREHLSSKMGLLILILGIVLSIMGLIITQNWIFVVTIFIVAYLTFGTTENTGPV